MPGLSTGVDGDGKKFGGGRFDETVFCDKAPSICVTSPNDTNMKIINPDYVTRNADGGITQFSLPADVTVNGVPLTPNNLNLTQNPSTLGGVQGGQGAIAGAPYALGSFRDTLVESFSGPHDALNAPHYYDSVGNLLPPAASGSEAWNWINVPIAAPFGISTLCSQVPALCSNVQNAGRGAAKMPQPPEIPKPPAQTIILRKVETQDGVKP